MGKMNENLKGMKTNATNYFGEIFTAIIIVALIIYSFVGIGLNEFLGDDFWIVFCVNFSIMVLVMSIWYPSAKEKAKRCDTGYIKQHIRYGELVDKVVNTNNQKNLSSFCDYATEENKISKIKQELIKINVDYDIYVKYKNDFMEVQKDDTLSDKQKKHLISLINNGVYVKKISYSKILTGLKGCGIKYDTNSDENKYDTLKIVSKILISVASSIFMGFIAFKLYGFTWESVAQLFTWIIMIVWNSFTSYSTGYKSISIKRADYYKKLKTFLEEFVSSDYFVGDKVAIKEAIEEEV